MIKSELYRGLIFAGNTPLASDLVVEQTGPMQLTVRAGSLTDTRGNVYQVPETVLDVVPGNDPMQPYQVMVGDVLVVLPFSVPVGCTDLSELDIYVLTVMPGFPEGTTAADWKMQTGGVVTT